MVVGGYPTPAYYDVELIDMTEQGRTCRKPDNFPGGRDGYIGAYFQERALVCGGYNTGGGSNYYSACYFYNTNGTWMQGPSMTEERGFASASFLNNQFWITGGENSGGALDSTEIFNSSSSSFFPFVDLPEERRDHNIISIDVNRAMLLGGSSASTESFIFNGSAWLDGPMLSRGRARSQAGLVTFGNATRMIVAAGGAYEQSTEFLIVDDDMWHFGPDLPFEIYGGASVQLQNSFLIVGGYNANIGNYLDTIWTFDIETEEWTELNQHLTTARRYTAAFLVPDNFC